MQKLNTTLVYVLSIFGILCCCVYGLGTALAIVAIVYASNQLKKYNENPEDYSNGKAMKTARVVAIVSLFISFIGLTFVLWSLFAPCAFYDWIIPIFENNPDIPQESLDQMYQAAEEAGCR